MDFCKRLAAAALALAVLGCSSLSVSYDYNRQLDYSRYRSFQWIGSDTKPDPAVVPDAGLLDQRVREAVEEELAGKGYKIEKGSAPADLLVAYHIGTEEKTDIDTEEYGYAYGRWATSNVRVDQYTEGSLVIDLVEPGQKELVWRGWATATLDPNANRETREKRLREAIQQIMANYPPPRQGG